MITSDQKSIWLSWIAIQILLLLITTGAAVLEAKHAFRKTRYGTMLLSGSQLRPWFLSLIATGLGIRAAMDIMLVLVYLCNPSVISPFIAVLSHAFPSLLLSSAYSIAAVFFAEVHLKSALLDAPLMAPLIAAANFLLYLLFFAIVSVTKAHHAHREFRLAGLTLLGFVHLMLGGAWFYFGVKLAHQLKTRSTQTRQQSSRVVVTTSGRSSDDLGTNLLLDTPSMKPVIDKLYFLGFLCPPFFIINGITELVVAVSVYQANHSTRIDLLMPNILNLVWFITEWIPATIVVVIFRPTNKSWSVTLQQLFMGGSERHQSVIGIE